MAADVKIVKVTWPAGSKTFTETTTLNFGTKDIPNPNIPGDADYRPVARPASGFSYPFWLSAALSEQTGNFTDIRNIRVYFDNQPTPDWALGTGGAKFIGNRDSGDIGCPQANYVQATGTENETGYYLADATNGHSYYNGQTTPIVDWTAMIGANNAKMLDSGPYTAIFMSKMAVLQFKVAPDATAQAFGGWQIVFRYQVVN